MDRFIILFFILRQRKETTNSFNKEIVAHQAAEKSTRIIQEHLCLHVLFLDTTKNIMIFHYSISFYIIFIVCAILFFTSVLGWHVAITAAVAIYKDKILTILSIFNMANYVSFKFIYTKWTVYTLLQDGDVLLNAVT
ncbi:hypothetical protein ACJX0J_025657 [Zea mays]